MKAISRIMLKGERYNNKVKLGGEIEIEIDPDFQPEEYANLEFEVLSAPRGVELESGNKVVTMWWVAMHNPADESYSSSRFKGTYHAEFDDIVGVYENEQLFGFGNYVIVKPVKTTASSQTKELVLNFMTFEEPNLSTVTHDNPKSFPYIKKGDVVINNRYTPWRLRIGNLDIHAAKRDGLVGIYQNGNILPFDGIIIVEPTNEDVSLTKMNGIFVSGFDYKRYIDKNGREMGRPVHRRHAEGKVFKIGKGITQTAEGETIIYHRRADNLLIIDNKKYYYCFEEDLFTSILE